jgi:PAS domain S-box-containing protein
MSAELHRADAREAMLAAELGTWRIEAPGDRFVADATTRSLLGLDEIQPVFTSDEALARVRAKDAAMLKRTIARHPADQPFSAVVEVAAAQGRKRYVLIRGRIEHTADGSRRASGVAFDHTGRSRLYEELERSEARFRMLAHGIPNAFFLLNRGLEIEFANDEFTRPFGRPASEILGLHIADVLGERGHPEHLPFFEQALAGKSSGYEARVPARNGAERHLLISTRPAFDEDGNVSGVISEAADITRLKQLEHAARASEMRFRALAEGVPNFLLFLDRDLRLEFCNDHFLRKTSWTLDTAKGLHISELLGPERYAERREHYERALRGESVEIEAAGAVGNEGGFFRFHYQPSFDEEGRIRGIFSTATDISGRRAAELALEAKQAELARSNQDLEQFAYVASHDLKAPLRAIGVLVEWLRSDLADYQGGSVQENLGLLEQRTARLGRLLDDLLAYSRVGRKVGKHALTDTGDLVRDIVELAGVPEAIAFSIETDLPVFETYAAPLEQVFRNLIGNAVKHHPGPAGRIAIRHEEFEDHYVFCVQDDGEGIPLEYADRIFQMFQTLKPRDEVEGSGMGLAIVSRIVGWQGGRVWFEPAEQGTGTVFKFQWKKSVRGQATARADTATAGAA